MFFCARTRYTATSSQHFRGIARCSLCDHLFDLEVVGIGTGKGVAPYFIGRGFARKSAIEESGAEANADALLMFQIAPCFSCGRRAPRAVAAAMWRRYRWSVVTGALVTLWWAHAVMSSPPPDGSRMEQIALALLPPMITLLFLGHRLYDALSRSLGAVVRRHSLTPEELAELRRDSP